MNTITLTFPQCLKHIQDSKVISQPLTEQIEQIGDGNEDVWTSGYRVWTETAKYEEWIH